MVRSLDRSRRNYQKVRNNFDAAKQSYKEIGQARNIMLARILKQQGLAICSEYHFIKEDNKSPSQEEIGVFLKDKMRLRFQKSYSRERRNRGYTPNDTVGGEISILSLCPEHFPEDPNSKDEDLHVPPRFGDIPEGLRSEVVMKDGRLTLVVNGMEIDTKKLKKTEEVGKIQLSGQSPSDLVPESPIYGHFGIPDLPPEPIRLGM
jgi:hypothetical protein